MPTVTTLDALLSGYTWNGLGVSGRPTFVAYSFDTTWSSTFAGAFPDAFLNSFQPFSAAEQDAARRALQAWGEASGLTFIEAPAGQGDIRFGVYDFSLGPASIGESAGFAFTPFVIDYEDGAWEEAFGGDIFIDVGHANFHVLVHEVGHALGLKHPFQGDVVLDPAVDDLTQTVMTYNQTGGPAIQLGALDVLAVQHLYGLQSQDGSQAASWSWDAAAVLLSQWGGAGSDTLAGIGASDRILAGAGDDYVMARGGADSLDGGDGADTMAGGEGQDTLAGGAGDDILDGDNDGDLINGGDGNDEIWGLGGADTLFGEAGDDYVSGGSGANRLSGGTGNDTLTAVSGANTMDGGEGYDELRFIGPSQASRLSYASFTAEGGSYVGIEAIAIFGGAGADTIVGGALADTLVGQGGADSLSSGDAEDQLFGGDGADTLTGGGGGDTFNGGAGDDLILPGDGGDEIWGGAGSDTIDYTGEQGPVDVTVNLPRSIAGVMETMHDVENLIGSAYADNLIGDAGANRLSGGAGADTIRGGDGANLLRGDEGADSLAGGADFDDINGNTGDDTASGGAGDDWVLGGKDQDLLFGDAGADIVYGNLGSDTCDGGAGADTLRGGQQDDVLRGGDGDDYLSGDRDNDTLTGGAGADIFHSFGDAGLDLITDFRGAEGDRVQLDPGTQYTVEQIGTDTVVAMAGGGRVVLAGVQLSSLAPGWIFVG